MSDFVFRAVKISNMLQREHGKYTDNGPIEGEDPFENDVHALMRNMLKMLMFRALLKMLLVSQILFMLVLPRTMQLTWMLIRLRLQLMLRKPMTMIVLPNESHVVSLAVKLLLGYILCLEYVAKTFWR